jgi:Na+-transporting NADH:ubiquinone oxidoreductase subunit NqrF
MGAGRLTIDGGAKDLSDGSFIYNVLSWKPEASYNVSGTVGEFVVQQPETSVTSTGGGASAPALRQA